MLSCLVSALLRKGLLCDLVVVLLYMMLSKVSGFVGVTLPKKKKTLPRPSHIAGPEDKKQTFSLLM